MTVDLPACPFCGDLASVENYITEACARCAGCGATITRRHAPEWDSGVPAVRVAWSRRISPAESGAGVCQGSEADTAQGNLPPDTHIPPGFVVAPREASWLGAEGHVRPVNEVIHEMFASARERYRPTEAMRRLGLSRATFYRWIGQGVPSFTEPTKAALPPPGGGKGAYSTDIAAAGPSACAAAAPHQKSEGEG